MTSSSARRKQKIRISALSCMLCFLSYTGLYGQDFGLGFEHYAQPVTELAETGDFYRDVLRLQEIPVPGDLEGFRWFRLSDQGELHLILKADYVHTPNKSEHICLSTNDFNGFISHLEELDIPYWDWPGKSQSVTTRADGVQQLYIQDPQGNWIEINDAASR